MKLPNLVTAGVLLLILGGISGWWILGQRMDVESDLATKYPSEGAVSKRNPSSSLWLVWYGDDTTVYRLQVDAASYEDLYSTLRQALVQDQMRLESIAGSHLAATIEPIFSELPPRLEPFLDDLFDVSSSASFISQAVSVAAKAMKNAGQPLGQTTAAVAGERVRVRLAAEVVTRFREGVLLPGFTMRALRGASGRAFLMMRQDLLADCDRYDRAFRGFVLKAPGTVESRDGDLGWRPDSSWQQGNATFLSLCPELRRANVRQLSDSPLVEAFAAAEETVHAQALELVRPLTDTSVDVAIRTDNTTTTLRAYGVPLNLAVALATGVNTVASAWVLAKKALDQLGGTQGRERFGAGLRATLKGLQTDSIQRLHSVYRNFIATEMERIGLNLAARSEGAWSHVNAQQ